jgi:hypothetical protein
MLGSGGLNLRFAARLGPSCIAISLALLAGSEPAAAAPKPISGKLSKPGYTVIAVAASGKASSVRAMPLRFKLRPPAKIVTLHLRAEDGTYAGPIVVGRERQGKRAIVGAVAGARLGPVDVHSHKGYAKVAALPEKWVEAKRWARAKSGVPIGAGNFGRVRSKHTHGGVPGDLDLDGIPDALDIDDDGDLVLDNVERAPATTAAARATQAAIDSNEFRIQSTLPLPITATANANAGSTDEQIEAAPPSWAYLVIGILPGDSTELDCGGSPNPASPPPLLGGLVYCSTGGTGRVFGAGCCGRPDWPRFPDAYDPDADGFGTPPNNGPPGFFFLSPGATTAQIGTGDLLIERVTTADVETQFAGTLPFVFATGPALVSYTDTAGDSATVSYPVADSDPGTGGNGFQAGADPVSGDVLLTLTYWRPQRRPIPPETGQWTDIGGLTYSDNISSVGSLDLSTTLTDCPASAYSTTDPNLTPAPDTPFTTARGFTDLAPDQPASPANTLTYTLNVSECLRSIGVSWDAGQDLGLTFQATTTPSENGAASAVQGVTFERQP